MSKVPNYDAYGLFRALHSHNPLQYSHIVGLSSHFYVYASVGAKRTSTGCSAPYRGGSQGLSSTYEQAHVDLDLLTLAS